MTWLAFNDLNIVSVEANSEIEAAVIVINDYPLFENFIVEQAFQPGQQFFVNNL